MAKIKISELPVLPDNVLPDHVNVVGVEIGGKNYQVPLSRFAEKKDLTGKVDKVSGKGLSTNDFADALKTKLDGIAEGANKTVVDAALSSTSANPVRNSAVKAALDGKLSLTGGTIVEGNAPIGDYNYPSRACLRIISQKNQPCDLVLGSGGEMKFSITARNSDDTEKKYGLYDWEQGKYVYQIDRNNNFNFLYPLMQNGRKIGDGEGYHIRLTERNKRMVLNIDRPLEADERIALFRFYTGRQRNTTGTGTNKWNPKKCWHLFRPIGIAEVFRTKTVVQKNGGVDVTLLTTLGAKMLPGDLMLMFARYKRDTYGNAVYVSGFRRARILGGAAYGDTKRSKPSATVRCGLAVIREERKSANKWNGRYVLLSNMAEFSLTLQRRNENKYLADEYTKLSENVRKLTICI